MSTLIESMQAALSGDWQVLPLPQGEKAAPPRGTTGRDKRFLEEEEVFSLASEQGNYGLSLEVGVIGLDFDLYKEGTLLTQMQKKLGVLPQTVSVSSKAKPFEEGFTAFFSVPTSFEAKVSYRNLDLIQFHHRYSVAGGSVHPSGSRYNWLLGGYPQKFAPGVEMLAELPQSWQEFLFKESITAEDEPSFEVTSSLEDLRAMCAGMQRTMTRINFRNSSRHDSVVKALWGLARQRSIGCQGFEVACEILFQQWQQLFSDSEQASRDIGFEFLRAKQGAVAKNPVRSVCNCWREDGGVIGVTRGLFR